MARPAGGGAARLCSSAASTDWLAVAPATPAAGTTDRGGREEARRPKNAERFSPPDIGVHATASMSKLRRRRVQRRMTTRRSSSEAATSSCCARAAAMATCLRRRATRARRAAAWRGDGAGSWAAGVGPAASRQLRQSGFLSLRFSFTAKRRLSLSSPGARRRLRIRAVRKRHGAPLHEKKKK